MIPSLQEQEKQTESVLSWRAEQLELMWPMMEAEKVAILAAAGSVDLHEAEKLAAKGCDAELAFRILIPLWAPL